MEHACGQQHGTPPVAGSVQIFGMDMDTNEKAIKERIGIVLDDGGFYDELNLSEMKSIIASAYKSWDELEYKKYLDRFSLNPKQKISTLSKGMRMKYALALALSHKAELLIMDEPTKGIDIGAKAEIYKLMEEIVASGKSIIMVSSEMTEVVGMSDRMLIMREGHLVGELEREEFEEERIITYAVGGSQT